MVRNRPTLNFIHMKSFNAELNALCDCVFMRTFATYLTQITIYRSYIFFYKLGRKNDTDSLNSLNRTCIMYVENYHTRYVKVQYSNYMSQIYLQFSKMKIKHPRRSVDDVKKVRTL